MAARQIGTTSSAITRVLSMRTGYNATDEWVNAVQGELPHIHVGY